MLVITQVVRSEKLATRITTTCLPITEHFGHRRGIVPYFARKMLSVHLLQTLTNFMDHSCRFSPKKTELYVALCCVTYNAKKISKILFFVALYQ